MTIRGPGSRSSAEFCKTRLHNIRNEMIVHERLYQHAFFAYGRNSQQAAEAHHRLKLDQNNLERWQQKLQAATTGNTELNR